MMMLMMIMMTMEMTSVSYFGLRFADEDIFPCQTKKDSCTKMWHKTIKPTNTPVHHGHRLAADTLQRNQLDLMK